MRPLALLVAAPLALALTGCGGEDSADQPRAPTKIANPGHEELNALSPANQRLGVMRAIRDNGNRCRRVEAAAYQQDYRNLAMWVALCDDGRHWALFIAPNRDTQVRNCADARELGLPQCRPLTGPGVPAPKATPG